MIYLYRLKIYLFTGLIVRFLNKHFFIFTNKLFNSIFLANMRRRLDAPRRRVFKYQKTNMTLAFKVAPISNVTRYIVQINNFNWRNYFLKYWKTFKKLQKYGAVLRCTICMNCTIHKTTLSTFFGFKKFCLICCLLQQLKFRRKKNQFKKYFFTWWANFLFYTISP